MLNPVGIKPQTSQMQRNSLSFRGRDNSATDPAPKPKYSFPQKLYYTLIPPKRWNSHKDILETGKITRAYVKEGKTPLERADRAKKTARIFLKAGIGRKVHDFIKAKTFFIAHNLQRYRADMLEQELRAIQKTSTK